MATVPLTSEDKAPSITPASSSSSGAYIPSWKRDPNARPEPYTHKIRNEKPSCTYPKRPPPPLKKDEHLLAQIGEKLQISVNDSFLVSRKAARSEKSPSSDTDDLLDIAKDIPAGEAVQELRCIVHYPEPNPLAVEEGVRVLYTRHRTDTVQNSVSLSCALFTCLSPEIERGGDPNRIFKYDGQFRIEDAILATKEEVLDFVKARDQSKWEKPATAWAAKLNSTWLKVTLRLCPEDEQTGNPMYS